jgi:hypothetical protein
MQADAPAEMKPDTGPRASVVAVFSGLPPSPCLPRSALPLKVTFLPLDIFLPRSKLRSTVTPTTTPGMPGFF